MDMQLISIAKQRLIELLAIEVYLEEPKEKIRLVDIDFSDPDQAYAIRELEKEGWIEKTEQENVYKISDDFYEKAVKAREITKKEALD